MSVAGLLAECDAIGIRLRPTGNGGLCVDAPQEALTPALVARLKTGKSELLELLRPEESDASFLALSDLPAHCEATQGIRWASLEEAWDDWLDNCIRHKRRDCIACEYWEHLWGGRYCSVCWPCTDELMVLRRPAGSAAELETCENVG